MLGSKHDRLSKTASNGTLRKSTNNTLVLDSSTIVKSTQPKYKTNDATNGRPSARLDPLDSNSQPRLGSSTTGRLPTSGRVNISMGGPTSFHHSHHSHRLLYQQRPSVGVITASSVSSGEVEITYRQNTQRRNSNIPGEVPSTTGRVNTDTFVFPNPSVSENTAIVTSYGSAQHHGTRNYDERKRTIHSLQTSRSQDLSAFTAYTRDPIPSSFTQSNSNTAIKNSYLQQLPPSQRHQATDVFLPFSAYRDPTVLEKYIRDQQQFVGLDQKNPEYHGSHNRNVETESPASTKVEVGTQTVQVDMSVTEWDLFERGEAEVDGYDSDVEAEEELAALDWGSFDDVGDRGSHRFHANDLGEHIERKRPSGPDIDMMVLGKRVGVPGDQEADDEEVFLEEGMGKICLFCSSSSSSEEDRGPFHDRKISRNRHYTKKSNPYARPSIYTQLKRRPLSPCSNNSNTFRQTPPRNCIRPVPFRLSPNYACSATNTPCSINNFSRGGTRSPLSTPSTRMSTSSALSSSVENLSSSSHSVSSYSTIPSSVSSPDSTKIAHLVTDGTRSAFSPTQHLFANLLDRKGERVSTAAAGGQVGKGTDKAGEEEVKQENVWDWQHMPFFHLERPRVGN